ncbi:hypothetical protein [uncultured Campylobacter sp.]|uniref:hypothetical protein n=1 Tax=uncultured Campylobacter sp. TaxID=218934 RepID=UPI0026063D18|nr:hypothetical protein [uncultured Campylobacter sp.]
MLAFDLILSLVIVLLIFYIITIHKKNLELKKSLNSANNDIQTLKESLKIAINRLEMQNKKG